MSFGMACEEQSSSRTCLDSTIVKSVGGGNQTRKERMHLHIVRVDALCPTVTVLLLECSSRKGVPGLIEEKAFAIKAANP